MSVTHCWECQAIDSQELCGKLRLKIRETLRSGGESGLAVVAGKPDQSLIINAL